MVVNNNDFFTQMEMFIIKLNRSSCIKCDRVFNKNINISLEMLTESNSNRCICIVENINGTKHQCSRSKKHGDLCGLHYKRKNTFKTIYNQSSHSNRKNYTIELVENKCQIDEKDNSHDNFVTLEWNNIIYRLDKTTGEVFYDNSEEWVYADLLHNLTIPISIY